jgi:hypothetical protein
MTPIACECCGTDFTDFKARYGVKPPLVHTRKGKLTLCRMCWEGIRWMREGFVSPDENVNRCAKRYREG